MTYDGILDAKRVDVAPFDAFTPLQVFGGMLSRQLGATASQAFYASTISEVVSNALLSRGSTTIGKRASKQETTANMVVDIAAGMAGWVLMDQILKARSG